MADRNRGVRLAEKGKRKLRLCSKLGLLYPQMTVKELAGLQKGICRKRLAAVSIVLTGTLGGMLYYVQTEEKSEDVGSLQRAAYGGEALNYDLYVYGIAEEGLTVSLQVNPAALSEEEAEALFAAVEEQLPEMICGENASLGEVYTSLELPFSYQGVTISWNSSNPLVINQYGELCIESIDIPAEGISIFLYALLEADSFQKLVYYEILVMPPEMTEEEQNAAGYKKWLQELEESSRTQRILELPAEWNGSALTYELAKEEGVTIWYIGIFGAALAACIAYWITRAPDRKLEKRKKQLQTDYARIVSRMNALLCAGYPVRSAWHRIAEEYRQLKDEKKQAVRYAYEELCLADAQIEMGQNEITAYHAFAKRCQQYDYERFAEILENDIVHGRREKALLQAEVLRAQEKRRNSALIQAQQAETKMLLPLLMMFAVVLAVLFVPALSAFG